VASDVKQILINFLYSHVIFSLVLRCYLLLTVTEINRPMTALKTNIYMNSLAHISSQMVKGNFRRIFRHCESSVFGNTFKGISNIISYPLRMCTIR